MAGEDAAQEGLGVVDGQEDKRFEMTVESWEIVGSDGFQYTSGGPRGHGRCSVIRIAALS